MIVKVDLKVTSKMDAATLYTLLTLVGSVLVIALTINAFFLKDILKNLSDLKLVFTKLNTEHGLYAEMVSNHSRQLDNLSHKYDKELEKCRNRLHTLEGAYKGMEKFLDNHPSD